MFFLTYLRRELRRRMRQAIFVALGLAVGVGLVITVIGASSGVKAAQAAVLRSLYGLGTDLTVTTSPKPPSGQGQSSNRITGTSGPGGSGARVCVDNTCYTSGTVDFMTSANYGTLSAGTIARIARLHAVAAAAGGLVLTDNRIVLSSTSLQPPTSTNVDGVDLSHPDLGPLSDGKLSAGHAFTAADADANVAVLDANYATANKLAVGSTVTVAKTKFKVIGIVTQPESGNPPEIYIPLARAQALAATGPGSKTSLAGDVNTIYVTASSAAAIPAVQGEIAKLLPGATITSSASLASEITGSAATAARLAGDLGKWLAAGVLVAAFAGASLLTMAAVARRVPEFGTLKALGWRSRRIVGQVLGESVATGIIGALIGVGLGFAGVAVIDAIAPKLSATIPSASAGNGLQTERVGPAGTAISGSGTPHATIAVPMSASVTVAAILLAVLLALAGGLIAGSFGGWRAARLRPAAALTRVA